MVRYCRPINISYLFANPASLVGLTVVFSNQAEMKHMAHCPDIGTETGSAFPRLDKDPFVQISY